MPTMRRSQRLASRALAAALPFLITLTACGAGPTAGNASEQSEPAPAPDAPPTFDELASATYAGVFDHPVTLRDGRWEGEAFVEGGASKPSAGLVKNFTLRGDVDGDGRDDTAVLLWEHSGGSGTRTHLAVVGRSEGSLVNLGTDLVGDRVQVQSGFIFDRQVSLGIVQAGPEDAACCPTQKALVGWRLVGSQLERTETEIVGTLSLKDLRGPEWVLAEIGRDQPVPPESQITISFEDGRVSGNGGCNRYFGTVTDTAPGRLEFSAMGTTMMACSDPAMDLERRYLRALADGASYGFSAGRLEIGSETGDEFLALVFTRLEPEAASSSTDTP